MNIMLVCSAGMSTSLLVEKMKSVIEEENLAVNVFAVSQLEAMNYTGNIDVILLGPQVRYLKDKMMNLWPEQGTVVEVINSLAYGTLNGKAVLKQAFDLVN